MRVLYFLFLVSICSCSVDTSSSTITLKNGVTLHILGTVQDGGSPHIGCQKSCCVNLWDHPDPARKVVSLGVVDHENQTRYLFDASPDLTSQMEMLNSHLPDASHKSVDGIFLTHAHIGHYAGLMYLGREALGGDKVPVFTMPRMSKYLRTNGPWGQLEALNNIIINSLRADSTMLISPALNVTPIQVPHRGEYSETVGYRIDGPNKKVLFIPDIDKWGIWERSIITEISNVDYAFLDATFYDASEVNHRDISEIPHPFVIESMELFDPLPMSEKQKIHFIHLNHTNDLLDKKSEAYKKVINKGYRIAEFGQVLSL